MFIFPARSAPFVVDSVRVIKALYPSNLEQVEEGVNSHVVNVSLGKGSYGIFSLTKPLVER